MKSITITLTIDEARALADAACDCAMEGLKDCDASLEQTWGPRWRKYRAAAITAADKLTAKLVKATS